jgi:cytoskeleton protein RodZ
MNDKAAMSVNQTEPLAASAPAPAMTAGGWLREARQKRGLHIVALAAMLKVNPDKLQALEADRWQDLPDMTFARALAKTVCRALKVDAGPLMTLLPEIAEFELDVSRGLNRPFRQSGHDAGFSLASLLRPVVWGPAILLILAGLVYVAPAHWLQIGPTADNVGAADPATAAAKAAEPLSAASQTTQLQQEGEVAVQVKASGASWIEIVDARGQTLLSSLLQPGEVQRVSGQPPLKLLVGNVAATEITLRGNIVDLSTQARDNVARLELN